MNKIIILESLEIGDIILTGEKTLLSFIIRLGLFSRYSHALIYAGNGYAYEADKNGVNLTNLNELFFQKKHCAVVRYNQYVTYYKSEAILAYLRSQIGVQYSIGEAILSWTPVRLLRFLRRPSKNQFCSRLVTKAYAAAGITIADNCDFTNPKKLINRFTKVINSATAKRSTEKIMFPTDIFSIEETIRRICFLLKKSRDLVPQESSDISDLPNTLKDLSEHHELNQNLYAIYADSMRNHDFLNLFNEIPEKYRPQVLGSILDGYEENLRVNIKILSDLEKNETLDGNRETVLLRNILLKNIESLRSRNLSAFFSALGVYDNNIVLAEALNFSDHISNKILAGFIGTNKKHPRDWSYESTTLEKILADCHTDKKLDTNVTRRILEIFKSNNVFFKVENSYITSKDQYLNLFTREYCYAVRMNEFKKSDSSELMVESLRVLCDLAFDRFCLRIKSKTEVINADELHPSDITGILWRCMKKELGEDYNLRKFQILVSNGAVKDSI